jgi:hypothetical protein
MQHDSTDTSIAASRPHRTFSLSLKAGGQPVPLRVTEVRVVRPPAVVRREQVALAGVTALVLFGAWRLARRHPRAGDR